MTTPEYPPVPELELHKMEDLEILAMTRMNPPPEFKLLRLENFVWWTGVEAIAVSPKDTVLFPL